MCKLYHCFRNKFGGPFWAGLIVVIHFQECLRLVFQFSSTTIRMRYSVRMGFLFWDNVIFDIHFILYTIWRIQCASFCKATKFVTICIRCMTYKYNSSVSSSGTLEFSKNKGNSMHRCKYTIELNIESKFVSHREACFDILSN